MCGRFTQTFSWDRADRFLDLSGPPLNLQPRYNVAPSQGAAVVRADRDGRRRLSMLCWGLIPAWAKDQRVGRKLINARSETARTKPSFRAAFAARRCLIPTDGFYEWKREGGAKQPWLIGMKDRGPFAFGGLWERWSAPGGGADAMETFAILTTAANETVAPIHDRMPVILPREAFGPWLAGAEVALGPYPPEAMTAWPVSALVNRPANDDPRCIESIAPALEERLRKRGVHDPLH